MASLGISSLEIPLRLNLLRLFDYQRFAEILDPSFTRILLFVEEFSQCVEIFAQIQEEWIDSLGSEIPSHGSTSLAAS